MICRFPPATQHAHSLFRYNDIACEVDAETKATLEAAGVDSILATHIGHLWARDPLVIFKERIEIDDEQLSDHFENIQSTNWQASSVVEHCCCCCASESSLASEIIESSPGFFFLVKASNPTTAKT